MLNKSEIIIKYISNMICSWALDLFQKGEYSQAFDKFFEALKYDDLPPESVEKVNDIIMASNNLLDIVNGILDISKIEANKMEIVNTEYNLKEEVEKLVKLIKPRIGEKPIEFKINIAPDVPEILYGDSIGLKEVLTIILNNSAKYTSKGYIELNINAVFVIITS